MIYIIGMACMTGTLSAQTVVDYSTFEQKVLDFGYNPVPFVQR